MSNKDKEDQLERINQRLDEYMKSRYGITDPDKAKKFISDKSVSK